MIDIPYRLEPRPDTGLRNGRLGIILFLASEMMLFGALFSSYVLLRTGSLNWPSGSDHLNLLIGGINTVILAGAGYAMYRATRQSPFGSTARTRLWLLLAIIGGVLFLAIKGFEWQTKFNSGEYPSVSTFLAIYFTLTGIHALHVVGGILAVLPMLAVPETKTAQFRERLRLTSYYWLFVDAIWLAIYLVVYLT